MAKKKGHKRIKPMFNVDRFTFRVKTFGTAITEVDSVEPHDEVQDAEAPAGTDLILEVTLAKVKIPSVGKRWHVIGEKGPGNRRAWMADAGQKFKIFIKDYILLVKDGKGKEILDTAPPTIDADSVKDIFQICEGEEATTCRYVIQGGVARKICS